jgi:iron complex outermembrane receptor protein
MSRCSRVFRHLAIVALCWTSLAYAQTTFQFDLPAQPLADALRSVGRITHVNVLFDPPRVDRLRAQALKATLTADQAFARLLAGTSLTYKFLDERTVTLSSALGDPAPQTSAQAAGSKDPLPANDKADKEGKKDSSQDVRLAQVDQGAAGDQTVEEKKEKKKEEFLQEVIVTGSRIPTVAGNEVQPVRRYTRVDIENSGQTTIGDFLNTLPEVSTISSTSLMALPGAQTVQLHGLPVGTTLTLLDGRRLETNVNGFFDLSNIPLAAVERIEILPVGASAVYGADGLAGAVNTILRKDFNGFELNAALDHASGVDDPTLSLAWGKSWERGSVSLIGSYQERGELRGTQREPTSLTQFPVTVPESTLLAFGSDVCAPGNVYSVDGSNLPGLSAPDAGIPAGITGRPMIGQFAATAGKLNVCNPYRFADITPQSQRESALFSAHYALSQSVDLFTELLASHGYLRNQLGAQVSAFQSFGGTVAANNPYNPFGEAVNVSFAYPGTGEPEVQSTSLIRPMIGVRGSVFSDWHYEVTAYLSRDQLHEVVASSDFQLISNALASSDPATALNPFTSGAPGTPQLLSSLIIPAVDISSTTFDDRTVSGQGILRGPVLQLPAGPLQAVIGAEYSQEKQDSLYNYTSPFLLHRNTYAAFSELRVPLLAGSDSARETDRLALTLAGRYDHSNDYGGKATWQSGLLWRASETLSLRGGYGLSYQAPLLIQISGPQTVAVAPLDVPDPFRGNQLVLYPVTQAFGPNANLKPETGDAFTLGLEYSSQALAGLHTSLTWYDLKITNYIGNESTQSLLAYPNLFPGAVIRAPPTPQDTQLGYLGQITQFNDTFYNFGDLRVAGFDADIRYEIDTRVGQFTPSVAIANVYKWQSALLPNTPEIDAVSQATSSFFGGGVGWSPRWKGTAALVWKQGPLSMNLQGRYLGRYLDYQLFVPNNNEIGNTWIYDFNARWEVGQALASTNPWLARSYVAFGAVNLLNKTPPFSYTPNWYDFQEYDIRGRILHLNAGLRF